MSNPFKPEDYKTDPGFHGAIQTIGNETISAMSALNMMPEPIENHNLQQGLLSETDAWAKHAMDHLKNVSAWVREMQAKYNKMENALFMAFKAGQIDEETLHKLLAILRGPSSLDTKK